MSMSQALLEALENAAAKTVPKETDTVGEDGLLICGICGCKKERWITLPASIAGETTRIKAHCMCDCEVEEQKQRDKEREESENMRIVEGLKSSSMLDSAFTRASFDAYQKTADNSKAFAAAQKYVAEFDTMQKENQGLIFCGSVGTGKTYTAACIANALMEKQIAVIMTSFVKILRHLQGRTESEESYMRHLNSASLLVLDDLGVERKSDYALEKVYDVIDNRVRSAKPMIITTNLKYQELMDPQDMRYKRIYDRIIEVCYPINMFGVSFRKSESANRFRRMQDLFDEK